MIGAYGFVLFLLLACVGLFGACVATVTSFGLILAIERWF